MNTLRFVGLKLSVVAALFFVSVSVSDRVEAGYQGFTEVSLPSNLAVLTAASTYTVLGDSAIVFSGFSSQTNNGVALPASSIGVAATSLGSMGFELTGPMSAETGGQTGSQNDINVDYTITSTGVGFNAISLSANGVTTGNGIAQVVENIYTDSSETVSLGSINVTNGTATANLNGTYTSLFVTKDITFSTYDASSTASFSNVYQNFYSPSSVPEPASIAMLGLGLAGAYAFARSRRRKAVNA